MQAQRSQEDDVVNNTLYVQLQREVAREERLGPKGFTLRLHLEKHHLEIHLSGAAVLGRMHLEIHLSGAWIFGQMTLDVMMKMISR